MEVLGNDGIPSQNMMLANGSYAIAAYAALPQDTLEWLLSTVSSHFETHPALPDALVG